MGMRLVVFLAAFCALGTTTFNRPTKNQEEHLSKLRIYRDIVLSQPEFAERTPAYVPKKIHQSEDKSLAICPNGFTGPNCKNPICYNESFIYSHDALNEGLGDIIERGVDFKCRGRFSFPVEQTLPDEIYVTVDATSPGNVYAKLYDPNGVELPSCAEQVISDMQAVSKFCDVYTTRGAGIYYVELQSDVDTACAFEITAPTYLYPDGGFVTDLRDDNVQTFIPASNEAIGRNPLDGVNSYLAFHLAHDVFPVQAEVVHIYSNGIWDQAFNLTTRYKCNAPHITTTSLNCSRSNYYHVKFQGVDEMGNSWQRVYDFVCDSNATPGPFPTGTPPPQSECFNGGHLYNGTCFCGVYYEGLQCELKKCMNGGALDRKDENCLCPPGYTGTYCQHVYCPTPKKDKFNLDSRVIAFVIRSASSMQAQMDQIVEAALRITAEFSTYADDYLQGFILSVVRDNEVMFTHEFLSFDQFIAAIRGIVHPPTDTDCADSLFLGVSEVLQQPSIQLYPRSPIFIFSDGVASDDVQTRYRLLNQLSYYRGPLFFMLSNSVTGRCNVAINDPGYQSMRGLAAFSQGLVIKTPVAGLAEAANNLATSSYRMDYLITNDLEDCRKAPKVEAFFVDESVSYVIIQATGENLTAMITSSNGSVYTPAIVTQVGDLFFWEIQKPARGSYLISITSLAADVSICQYRVLGRSNYDLFVGITDSINSDDITKQPVWRESSHVVARINNVWNPDLNTIHAEAIITTNDIGGQRQVVYASSGIFRDRCAFYMYFGSFTCTRPDMLLYYQIYLTDSIGNTISRVSTGFCAASIPTPIPPEGCGNGGVMVNGTCICPYHYTGAKCEQILCENQGTPLYGTCQCPAGYSGPFCEVTACHMFNGITNFNNDHKTLSVLIHDSISTRSVFRTLNHTVTRTVYDIHAHPFWIEAFQLIRLNDKGHSFIVDSTDANDFIKGIRTATENNLNNVDYSCKELDVFGALYDALKDHDTSFGGIVYIFVNGLAKTDATNLQKVYNHLEMTKTTINVIQTSTAPCGSDIGEPQSTVLMSLAEFTGGKFTLTMASKAGDVFSALPTLYNSQLVTENFIQDCSKPTTFYIPVDAMTQSFVVDIQGDLLSEPIFIAPDGSKPRAVSLWNDIGYGSRGEQIVQPCDAGWDALENRCFKFSLMPASWDEARTLCHQEGASLASIFSAEDQDFMSYQAGGAVDYWTGLNDRDTVGNFVWDNVYNITLKLDTTLYTNWGSAQPSLDPNNRCVVDQQVGGKGWAVIPCNTVKPFVCQKHIYNQFFEPSDPDQNLLSRGIWEVKVQADSGCSVVVSSQSELRIYTEYVIDVHDDYGYPEPLQGTDNNRVIAHVTGLLPQTKSSLEYIHFYQDNLTIILAEPVKNRDSCLFEYISAPFQCPSPSFQMMLSGVDNYGYLYQRIVPVTCLGGPTFSSCENGGVYAKGQCVCPPNYWGEFCQLANCENGGHLTGSLSACRCPTGFTGTFCETPICTRNGNTPDINKESKTFVLIIDGTNNGDMKAVQADLSNTLTAVIKDANANYQGWFTNFVGVVFRDSTATPKIPIVSATIKRSDSNAFVQDVVNEINNNPYTAPTGGRAIFTALAQVLGDVQVAVRSTAYVITNGFAEDYTDEDLVLDAMAHTHTAVNFLVIGDTTAPGNSSYSSPEIDTLFAIAHTSGGSVYQLPGPSTLAKNWKMIQFTLHHTFYVISSARRNCSNYADYLQLGANGTANIIDVFAQTKPTVTIINPLGKAENAITDLSTNTNTLDTFVQDASDPGIWTFGLDQNLNNVGMCLVNVRALSDVDVYVAFTQDVESDGGLHSGDAYLFPEAGDEMNAVVASLVGAGDLSYVQMFDIEERRLQFASPLIKRQNCTYPYISQSLFRCNRHSFVVAIDGNDVQGHPFRRMFNIHCIGFIPTRPPMPTGPLPSFPARTTTPPLPVYPTCDSSVPKVDIVFAFDSSMTTEKGIYVEILDKFYSLAQNVIFDKNHVRVLMGTYDNSAHFENQDFNNTNSVSDYLIRLINLMWTGYTGNDGNNIQSVLDYLTKSENQVTPFRVDARKIVLIVSSLGWDKGNFYNGAEHGFPDPSSDANDLKKLGVEFFPIGYGEQANMSQLQKLSNKCARSAKSSWEIEDSLNYFLSVLCKPTIVC